MAVYVDPLMNCVPNKDWRWSKSCHLVADSLEELHKFAQRIGMKRSWFQATSRVPHYDLNVGRRKKAIELGVIELSRKEFVERFLRKEKIKKAKNSS